MRIAMISGIVGMGMGLVVGRVTAPAAVPEVVPAPERRAAASDEGPRRVRFERARPERTARSARPATVEDVPASVVASLREEVRAELEEERREQHRERRAAMLDHRLDDLAEFAREKGLDDATQQALEEAVIGMHDAMEDLGPPKGPSGSGPPEEDDARRALFDRFDGTVREVLGDDLAGDFHEWMRPGPPRR
ncbi:MAG: hypothetical protein R3F61_24965 [Myxococcota bacterium]